KEELIKTTDIKSLFIFVLEYFLKDNPTDNVIFLYNSIYDNPYKVCFCESSSYNVTDKLAKGISVNIKNNYIEGFEPLPMVGFLSIKKISGKTQKFHISGDSLNYSAKLFRAQNFNDSNLYIKNYESGEYDYKSMIMILNNIADISNTKYVIYKHNVMEKDFALNMIIDDLLNTNC
ncbi:MAG: hypothetical protein QW478_13030, partial [Candidatus Micrarchaeaceae archaeon]